MDLQLKLLEDSERFIPQRVNPLDAGFDCRIARFGRIENSLHEGRAIIDFPGDEYPLLPQNQVICFLGFATALPQGYYAQLVPRSSYALWDSLTLMNSPGTIDAGYRREWAAIVHNHGDHRVMLRRGTRICQFIIRRLPPVTFVHVDELPPSKRGEGGFGSTGE